MKGRTYRYLETPPLYPFGYGLSYTRFEYRDLAVSSPRLTADDRIEVTATVKNAGKRDADEVVQLYVKDLESSVVVPHHSLRGFQRLRLDSGDSKQVSFELAARDLAIVDDRGQRVLEPGRFRLSVGGSQPDERSRELTGRAPLSIDIEVVATDPVTGEATRDA
jgi:beta-glucosidase